LTSLIPLLWATGGLLSARDLLSLLPIHRHTVRMLPKPLQIQIGVPLPEVIKLLLGPIWRPNITLPIIETTSDSDARR
jgi:hypothetical protein